MHERYLLIRPLRARFAAAFFLMLCPIWAQISPSDPNSSDLQQIRADKPRRIEIARQAVDAERARRGLTGDHTFHPAASTLDATGALHVRFIRRYQNLRVIGGGAKAVVNREGTSATVKRFIQQTVAPATIVPIVSEAAALQKAADAMGVLLAELDAKQELAILAASKTRAEARLVWSVLADAPNADATILALDALTGAILSKNVAYASDIAAAAGTGHSYHSGTVDVTTRYDAGTNKYKLQDSTRGDTLIYDVEDKKATSSFHGNPYYNVGSNTWGNGADWSPGFSTTGATGQTAAVDAFFGARRAWDTLKNVFNRWGLNDGNDPMKLRVHVRKKSSELYSDAHWDGYFANFGDGKNPDSGHRADPMTVAHELGHGIWTFIVSDDWNDNQEEARGLNEGHGDIMSSIVNHYIRLGGGNGSIVPTHGSGMMEFFEERAVHPQGYTSSSGWQGLRYYTNNMGSYEEHAQGCAYGHMFATLAMGAPSIAASESMPPCNGKDYSCLASFHLPQGMGGIGMDKAAKIWYAATLLFPPQPTFASVRADYLEAAAGLYGQNSPEYKAVMNAFKAINVGDAATDTGNPTVSLAVPVVDDEEQSVKFTVSGSDDSNVHYFRVSLPGTSANVYRNPGTAYLSLAGSAYGKKELAATAYDAAGNTAQTSRQISYVGANHAIQNGGFENWGGNWTATSSSMFDEKVENAFLGTKYASFSSNTYMYQNFTIPSGADNCKIGYRVWVSPKVEASGPLYVEILRPDMSVETVINTIDPTTVTTDSTSNNYKRYTWNTVSCAGKTRKLRFRTNLSGIDHFRVDNVFVAYYAWPTADFEVTVDEAERTVIFETKNIQNIQPAQIDYVEFGSPGAVPHKDQYAPYLLIESVSEFALNATYYVKSAVVNHAGTKVWQSATVPFIVREVNQLLNNPGMESGGLWWTNTSGGGWCPVPGGDQSPLSFTGLSCGRFTGNGTIYQDVSIPAGPGQAELTFRLKTVNAVSTHQLYVEVIHAGLVSVVQMVDGLDDSNTGRVHNGYKQFKFNMTSHMGKNIRLRFRANNGAGAGVPMDFRVDNVGLTYKQFGLTQ